MYSNPCLPQSSTPHPLKPEPTTLHPPTRQIFMFTEDQVQRQLEDMRQQTAFMKTFRSALSSALQEIKTLRTALSIENAKNNEVVNMAKKQAIVFDESASVNKSFSSTFAPCDTSQLPNSDVRCTGQCYVRDCADNFARDNAGANVDKKCICDGLKSSDFTLLKEYLDKIKVDDVESKHFECLTPKNNSDVFMEASKIDPKPKTPMPVVKVDIIKQSDSVVSDSVSRLEALKPCINKKNATISQLRRQLRFSDQMRIKRETKLEQKLAEAKEWKRQFENSIKANEKQLKLNHGLKVALDAERERVKACEKLLGNLDSTRRAFEALKNQAGELMETLHRKDLEIFELQKKVHAGRRQEDRYLHIQDADSMTSHIHGVAASSDGGKSPIPVNIEPNHGTCIECSHLRKECDVIKEKYEGLQNEFEIYQERTEGYDFSGSHHRDNYGNNYRNQPHSYFPHRGRLRPPYSPHEDYYQRISRRPIRRQLNYDETERHAPSIPEQSIHGAGIQEVATSILSPIDESDEEGFSDVIKERKPPVEISLADNRDILIKTGSDVDMSPETKPAHNESVDMLGRLHSNQNLTQTEFSGEITKPTKTPISHRHGKHMPSQTFIEKGTTVDRTNLTSVLDTTDSTENVSPAKTGSNQFKLAKTSYLELGHSSSSSPCNSVSSSTDLHDAVLQEPHPHAFLNNYPDLTVESQDDILDNSGFSIHSSNTAESAPVAVDFKPREIGVIWHSAANYESKAIYHPAQDPVAKDSSDKHAINTSQRDEDNNSVKRDVTKSKSKSSRYVTYKGHRIDITRFSIHAFRDIVWTLDGGPGAADDFIKYLASLAKKLNANPKWAGKHALGKPKDWLELRGLY